MYGIANASMEELALCPGLGPNKVKRIYDTFHGNVVSRKNENAIFLSQVSQQPDEKRKKLIQKTLDMALNKQ